MGVKRVVILDQDEYDLARAAVDSWRYTQRDLRPFHLRDAEDAQVGAFLAMANARSIGEVVDVALKVVHGYACGCEQPWPTNVNYVEMGTALTESLTDERTSTDG